MSERSERIGWGGCGCRGPCRGALTQPTDRSALTQPTDRSAPTQPTDRSAPTQPTDRVGMKGAGRSGNPDDVSTARASEASEEERNEPRDRSGRGLSGR